MQVELVGTCNDYDFSDAIGMQLEPIEMNGTSSLRRRSGPTKGSNHIDV